MDVSEIAMPCASSLFITFVALKASPTQKFNMVT